jgi:hypothetical protein
MTTITLPSDLDERLTAEARRQGTTPERLALDTLRKSLVPNGEKKARLTEAEKQAARAEFERHFGEVDLGHPTGTDNEQIDTDLAREYGNNHETD